MNVEARLAELGITLPEIQASTADLVPVVVWKDVAYVSGQLPKTAAGEIAAFGKVPAEVSVAQAQECARLCVIQALASLKQHLGSLERVERIIKLTGFVNSDPTFGDQPTVINAASRLLVEIFGENGRHARSAVGMGALPRRVPVEIEFVVGLSS